MKLLRVTLTVRDVKGNSVSLSFTFPSLIPPTNPWKNIFRTRIVESWDTDPSSTIVKRNFKGQINRLVRSELRF